MKKVIIYTYDDINYIIDRCKNEVLELEKLIISDEEYKKELIPDYLMKDAIKNIDKHILNNNYRLERLLKLLTYMYKVKASRYIINKINWFDYDNDKYVLIDEKQQQEYNALYDYSE